MSEPRVDTPHHGGRSHGGNGTIHTVVIHDEEFPLGDSSAEAIANYFAQPDHGDSCAHYVIDRDSERHVVADGELAYHAPPNGGTIGIERDGYASWNAAQWNSPAAQQTTCRVAARTAELTVRFNLPPVWRSVGETAQNLPGVTSHANRSKAFRQSEHSDPGPAFPTAAFMALVVRARVQINSPHAVSEFQRARGLTIDGDAGPVTMNALAGWLYRNAVPAKAATPAKAVTLPPRPRQEAPAAPPAPVPAPVPAPTPTPASEAPVNLRLLYRKTGEPAAYALTADGQRVWVDGDWYKAAAAAGLAGPVVELPATSNVWNLPVQGATPK